MTDQGLMQDTRRILAQLHKRRGIVLTCVVVSLLVAVLVNYTSRPVYRATTQILIDRDTPDVLPNQELVDIVQGGMADYQTQYQLLKSKALAERAVEQLQLRMSPELATGPMMSPWERAQRLLGRPPKSIVGSDGIPLSPAAGAFRSRIEVDPIPGTRLVNLRFNAYDPQVAAAVQGGFKVIEFTLSCPQPFDLIEKFAQQDDLIVGAGTVLRPEDARRAVEAGAKFIVSPVVDEAVIEKAVELGAVAMPGTHTPTEMLRAHRAGAQLQKLFPCPAGGPDYLASMLGPMP